MAFQFTWSSLTLDDIVGQIKVIEFQLAVFHKRNMLWLKFIINT